MSQAQLKKDHQSRVGEVAEDAALFGKMFIEPILDSTTTFRPDNAERRSLLSEAVSDTFLSGLDEKQATEVASFAANAAIAYHAVYDSLPPDEVQASAIMTMKGLVLNEQTNAGTRASKMINDSMSSVDGAMSSRDGIPNRNHQIAMIVPVTLMQATSSFVTPVPTSKDKAEIFVIDRLAGSTFGDLSAGDVIDESFNGQYGTMDQFYAFGVGDGTKTKFDFDISTMSNNPNATSQPKMPIRPGYIRVYHDMDLIGSDKNGDGLVSGMLSIAGADVMVSSSAAANYATGKFTVTFTVPPAAGVIIHAKVDIDIEKAPQLIPTIEHKIKSFILMPHEAAITANESIQSVFAARREYNLEIRAMQMTAARNVLAAEKDRRRLGEMWKFASRHFDWPRLAKDALSHSQHYADLKEFFGKMTIQMIQDTHKSGIKGFFFGLDALNLVMSAPGFKARPNYRCINQPHYVGRFGEYEVYCDPQAPTWDGLAIGKGDSYGDSAYIAADAISAIHYPHPMGAPANGAGRGLTHQDTFYELAFRDIHPYRGRQYLYTFSFVPEQGV